jgi:hypothetical protein
MFDAARDIARPSIANRVSRKSCNASFDRAGTHGAGAKRLRQFGNFQFLPRLETPAHQLIPQRAVHALLDGLTGDTR